MITREILDKLVDEYSYFYFSKNKYTNENKTAYKADYLEKKYRYLGEKVRIGSTDCKIEAIAFDALNPENPFEGITWQHIAWKAGRLKFDKDGRFIKSKKLPFVSKDCKYAWDGKNGMGKKIDNIEKYLAKINDGICAQLSEDLLKDEVDIAGQFERAYKTLMHWNTEYNVNNLGTVYTITLIFFLSKGKFPIYDKFAHKALRAIEEDNNPPADITVPSPPDKKAIGKVIEMYSDYCELIKTVFSQNDCKLSRTQDQALWVYGHSKSKYPDCVTTR